MVDSVDFAKFILARVREPAFAGIAMGETKLHKLLYICDGFLLAGGVNFIKEHARAWNYGPVYPRVHRWIAQNPGAWSEASPCSPAALRDINDAGVAPLVDSVIAKFGPWTASDLSDWSHRPGSPWERALERGRGMMNSKIDKGDMKDYFQGLVRAVQ